MTTTWETIDRHMAELMRQSGVTATDLIGLVSKESLHAWFGYDDTNTHGSVVYFVSVVGRPLVKIGFTGHLRQRLSHIQHYSIDPVVFEAAIPGDRITERALHRRFAHHRVTGEWFTRTPELDALIETATDRYPQPDLMVESTSR